MMELEADDAQTFRRCEPTVLCPLAASALRAMRAWMFVRTGSATPCLLCTLVVHSLHETDLNSLRCLLFVWKAHLLRQPLHWRPEFTHRATFSAHTPQAARQAAKLAAPH